MDDFLGMEPLARDGCCTDAAQSEAGALAWSTAEAFAYDGRSLPLFHMVVGLLVCLECA